MRLGKEARAVKPRETRKNLTLYSWRTCEECDKGNRARET